MIVSRKAISTSSNFRKSRKRTSFSHSGQNHRNYFPLKKTFLLSYLTLVSLLPENTFKFQYDLQTLCKIAYSPRRNHLLVIGSWHYVQKSLIQQAVLQSAIRVSSFVINSALVQSISLHRFVFLSTRERQIGRAYRVYAVFFSKFQMGICAEREIGTLKENRILSNTILR